MVNYNNFSEKGMMKVLPLWERDNNTKKSRGKICFLSVLIGFLIGLGVGVWGVVFCKNSPTPPPLINTSVIKNIFINNSYGGVKYPTVSFLGGDEKGIQPPIIEDGIFWGEGVENEIPQGFAGEIHEAWGKYLNNAIGVRLEKGCGRMQNRLLTFQDGTKGCVRYRQNTDQIQGELFSFYLAQILKIPNLPPSAISLVNLSNPLWTSLKSEIASAQWNSNRPIVLTKYISNLDVSNIPKIFRPLERHLNKNDLRNLSISTSLKNLIELAQWSDLIIFDYLTANLDRIVNNLYNYQWNSNIMEAPAHNLAQKLDSNLLIFLDNESGLLHGYRLLDKYEIYHTILLDNLCVFRRRTVDVIKGLHRAGNVGVLLKGMFERTNDRGVKDVLPNIPERSVKILNKRIEKVYNQILKCEVMFGENLT